LGILGVLSQCGFSESSLSLGVKVFFEGFGSIPSILSILSSLASEVPESFGILWIFWEILWFLFGFSGSGPGSPFQKFDAVQTLCRSSDPWDPCRILVGSLELCEFLLDASDPVRVWISPVSSFNPFNDWFIVASFGCF
jgi:hypothetical protein